MKLIPPRGPFYAKIAVALLLTGPFCLAQDTSNGNGSNNDGSALRSEIQKLQKEYDARMQKMQKEYEDRISAMEGEMKVLESKADSGSILNTRLLTDANGVAAEGPGPTLDESFVKSLTRNFTFSAYVRAGFQFNGNGGGGNFSFDLPDFPGAGRQRLGNENDTYMELTWMQAHMLGDSPDVMDVSMTFTPAIRYVQSRNTFTGSKGGVENSGNDFDFVLRQAFLEMKNVFKAAPEVTFWAGERFYDRFNTDPEDYFWLDDSGYGAGVYNIDAGVGKLWLAWIGGLNDNYLSQDIGTLFKHTFDLRLKEISLGPIPGNLALVLIGNYEKGGTFTQGYDSSGNITNLTNPIRTNAAWGVGGGAIYKVQFGPGGSNNSFTAYALFGKGATDFSASDSFSVGSLQSAENLYLFYHPGHTGTVNVGDVVDHSFRYRAGFQFYTALPWYHSEPAPVAGTSKEGKGVAPAAAPASAPLPWLSVALFGDWEESYSGSAVGGTNGSGVSKIVSGHVHDVQFGVRPAFWLADNIAIQGQFSGNYESNNTNGSGYDGFGKAGWLGVFDIGPVIKPKGGYYTKPELRFFAAYAIWSDSLKGMVTPAQENGTDWMPPYNSNQTHGWLFGTQVEWFF